MNDEKTNKIISSKELDNVLPKYEPIKLSGKNLAQNYVSAFNTGMNIYQCVNQLQGHIEWVVKAVNDVVKSWNVQVGETIDQTKAIARETATEQFNVEWENKQPELIEQVNTLTTNQFNNEKSVFNDELDTLNVRIDAFSNPNLLINPDFKINQRGETSYTSAVAQTIKVVYSVDRWCLYGHSLTVNSDKSVTITPTTYSDGALIQDLETPVDGDITVQVYVVGVSGAATVSVGSSDGSSTTEIGTLKNGLNTFTFSKGIKRLIIRVKSGTLTLKYAKVEQGSVATPFITPNAVEEYPKCQRYFQYIPKLYCVPLIYERDLISVSGKFFQATNGNFPTEMRTTPTLTYKSLGQSDNSTFTGSASFELNSKSIDTVTIDREISNFTVTINAITLDAEIY